MAKNYCTAEMVEAFGGARLTSAQQAQWATILGAAEAVIDRITGRSFVADGTAENPVEKKYDGDGTAVIVVDDLLSLVTLTVDDLTVAATDYVLRPTNTTPKSLIELLYITAARDHENVVVSGVWGYSSTVPEAIARATALLVGRSLAAPAWVRSQSVDGYSVSYGGGEMTDFELARELGIAHYVRPAIGVV